MFSMVIGRDLSEGGTWMGVSSQGRFAVLTNYRTHHTLIDKTATSRGRSLIIMIVSSLET